MFITVLIVVSFTYVRLVQSSNSTLPPGHYCVSGSTWREECNDCYCDKGIPFCSALVCQLPRGIVQRPCLAGTTWKRECNNCSCDNGVPVCRNIPCPPKYTYMPPGLTANKKCVHGTTWRIGCNDCFCHHGLTACTVKPCNYTGRARSNNITAFWNPTVIFPVGLNQKGKCIDGTSWKNGCNECFCSNGIPACTLKACNNTEQQPETCINGTVWKRDCNECYCHQGTPACTLRTCPQRNSSVSVDICKNGNGDCSICPCGNGTTSCPHGSCSTDSTDNMVEVTQSTTPSANCISGSSWQEECSTCTCDNGVRNCTDHKCTTDNAPSTSPYMTTVEVTENKIGCECIVGSKWKEDCNECSCPSGFRVCVNKPCSTQPTVDQKNNTYTYQELDFSTPADVTDS